MRKALPRSNPARRKREFSRTYGSKERVEWFKGLPCHFCGKGPSENAHCVTGGASRKADAHTIIPADRACHEWLDSQPAEWRKTLLGAAMAYDALFTENR